MHERFRYKTKDELLSKVRSLGHELPYCDDVSSLFEPITIDGYTIPNRLVVQPMEGYDSTIDGSPSELTMRRYLRYAEGGSGIIWLEAVAVSSEGRSNPGQLWLTSENVSRYAAFVKKVKATALANGINPLLVIQLTHSGRYSKPNGTPKPMVAEPNPILDKVEPHVLTDDEIQGIEDDYIVAAKLAIEAGFDAIDIKACHGYLLIELLASKNIPNSLFRGPSTAQRFKFMLDIIDRIKREAPSAMITSRMNVSDYYQGGFCFDEKGNADFSDSFALMDELMKRDIHLINISMGSPYHNPHVSRPYDNPVHGFSVPNEHPLTGVMRMINNTALFQKRYPNCHLVGTGYSYLRQYAPNVGAAVLGKGMASFIGFGRNSFAYPSMPKDLQAFGKADPNKVCITCSACSRLISNQRHGGCAIRDREIYGPELKRLIDDGK